MMERKTDPMQIIALGALLLIIPLTGLLDTFFPSHACPTCGLLDLGCYLAQPGCIMQNAAIGAWQSIVASAFSIGGLLVIFYGVYRYSVR